MQLDVAEVYRLAQRRERITSGHEFMRHIAPVAGSGDPAHHAIPLHFLSAIQLVAVRDSTGVEVPEPVTSVAPGDVVGFLSYDALI